MDRMRLGPEYNLSGICAKSDLDLNWVCAEKERAWVASDVDFNRARFGQAGNLGANVDLGPT